MIWKCASERKFKRLERLSRENVATANLNFDRVQRAILDVVRDIGEIGGMLVQHGAEIAEHTRLLAGLDTEETVSDRFSDVWSSIHSLSRQVSGLRDQLRDAPDRVRIDAIANKAYGVDRQLDELRRSLEPSARKQDFQQAIDTLDIRLGTVERNLTLLESYFREHRHGDTVPFDSSAIDGTGTVFPDDSV